jgi:hypothetical protein
MLCNAVGTERPAALDAWHLGAHACVRANVCYARIAI